MASHLGDLKKLPAPSARPTWGTHCGHLDNQPADGSFSLSLTLKTSNLEKNIFCRLSTPTHSKLMCPELLWSYLVITGEAREREWDHSHTCSSPSQVMGFYTSTTVLHMDNTIKAWTNPKVNNQNGHTPRFDVPARFLEFSLHLQMNSHTLEQRCWKGYKASCKGQMAATWNRLKHYKWNMSCSFFSPFYIYSSSQWRLTTLWVLESHAESEVTSWAEWFHNDRKFKKSKKRMR